MTFNPTTGGHAPAVLRDAFLAFVYDQPVDELLAPERLCGLLWNCSDTLPRAAADDLELPAGSTYAQAARAVKARLRRRAT